MVITLFIFDSHLSSRADYERLTNLNFPHPDFVFNLSELVLY